MRRCVVATLSLKKQLEGILGRLSDKNIHGQCSNNNASFQVPAPWTLRYPRNGNYTFSVHALRVVNSMRMTVMTVQLVSRQLLRRSMMDNAWQKYSYDMNDRHAYVNDVTTENELERNVLIIRCTQLAPVV